MKRSRNSKGHCLVSQQIREEIAEGRIMVCLQDLSRNEDGGFCDTSLEKRVQPSSFEPVIGDEIFVLDNETQVVFRPNPSQTVYRALLELPKRQRQRFSIEGGFQTNIGFNYLVPLVEKLRIKPGESVKSSPKSSIGRLFPYTRLVSDFSPSFDQVNYQNILEREVQMWLLLQPTAFNMIIHPGLTLNQLRFFLGNNVSLSQEELIKEFKRNPLLFDRRENGTLVPSKPIITNDGMQMSVDLSGQNTQGIVALRARKNPTAIDLLEEDCYNAEDFLEPVITSRGKVRVFGGEKYLFASKGVLVMPSHLSAELRRHSGVSARGTFDEAGFIDNGWVGDLNFEATLNESGGMNFDCGSDFPVSFLEVFRTDKVPDKIYGEGIGSHYKGQLGVRPPKYFRSFDFSRAAKTYRKLDKDVLVYDAIVLRSFRQASSGFEPISVERARRLIENIGENGFFHSRYDCEDDEDVLQVVPYTVVFGTNQTVYTYLRSSDISQYGEQKLFGKKSIGFGGHILRKDSPDFVSNGQRREFEEEVRVRGSFSRPKLIGTLYAEDKAVDRVHFGLVYVTHVDGILTPNESSGKTFRRESFDGLLNQTSYFETWSRVLIPYLPLLSKT